MSHQSNCTELDYIGIDWYRVQEIMSVRNVGVVELFEGLLKG